MKRRLLYFALGLLCGMIGYFAYQRYRTPAPTPPTPVPSALPANKNEPAAATPVPAEVPIQEGKTIDFSSGKPEVRETDEDRAAIERAKREMDEATKDVTFAPTKSSEKKE